MTTRRYLRNTITMICAGILSFNACHNHNHNHSNTYTPTIPTHTTTSTHPTTHTIEETINHWKNHGTQFCEHIGIPQSTAESDIDLQCGTPGDSQVVAISRSFTGTTHTDENRKLVSFYGIEGIMAKRLTSTDGIYCTWVSTKGGHHLISGVTASNLTACSQVEKLVYKAITW